MKKNNNHVVCCRTTVEWVKKFQGREAPLTPLRYEDVNGQYLVLGSIKASSIFQSIGDLVIQIRTVHGKNPCVSDILQVERALVKGCKRQKQVRNMSILSSGHYRLAIEAKNQIFGEAVVDVVSSLAVRVLRCQTREWFWKDVAHRTDFLVEFENNTALPIVEYWTKHLHPIG